LTKGLASLITSSQTKDVKELKNFLIF